MAGLISDCSQVDNSFPSQSREIPFGDKISRTNEGIAQLD